MLRFKNTVMIQKTNKRQDFIIELLEKRGSLSISQIVEEIAKNLEKISKMTANRDINGLISLGFAQRESKGRAAFYRLTEYFRLIKQIPVDDYFKNEPEKRMAQKKFNFHIFAFLKNIFTEDEKKLLKFLDNEYQNNINHLSPTIIKKEIERLIIEFSWKSSQIEGNTYTLLETEALIKNKQEAKGRKKEEAIMILNHKKALDFIFKNKNKFKTISIKTIEHIHSIIIEELGIPKNIRKSLVGITGTAYKPLDNEWQIKEALEKTCELINKEKDFFTRSIIASAMIAYIQPFEDGNKRTARILNNAILLANDSCPISYRNASEAEYKKAIILFFEQNNISYFKKLFLEQYEFAVKNYFRA
jgi:Fic family protein